MKNDKASARERNRQGVVAETQVLETDRVASKTGALIFSLALFVIAFGLVLVLWQLVCGTLDAVSVIAALAVAWLVTSTVHIAQQWEKIVVLRFGKLNRVSGPGLVFTLPIVEYCSLSVDMRTRSVPFGAKETLTADLIPLDIDAVLYWMVWDAEKACLEVENYPKAVLWSAQTAMRDAIGQLNLADLSLRRKQIDRELQEIMGAKCERWGITVMSVEIRDIMVPRELQDALSKEAQAERERNARVILAEVEKDISEMFVEAAEVYDRNPKAMQLRAMNLAYEGAKDGKGVLLAPSSLADGFDVSKLFKGE